MPQGLRVVASLLAEKVAAEDIAVCYPDQLHLFVGPETRVVGLHAHNPLGITFATDVYAPFYGPAVETINAAEFCRLITHTALRAHQPHVPMIYGVAV